MFGDKTPPCLTPHLTSCAEAATVCPRSSTPSEGAEAPRAAEPTAM